MTNKYCFVLDCDGKSLTPTKENKGWFLIRKGKAILEKKYPMTIRLNKCIEDKDLDKSKIHVGIDDGSKYVGLSIVQEGQKRNKVIFKSTIELRKNVSLKIKVRRGYRQYRRYHKRHRPSRFNNRRNKEFIAPSIKQKKQSIIRVVKELNKHIRMSNIYLEDVKIDTNSFARGKKLYGKQHSTSYRKDKSKTRYIRERDNNSCRLCGITKGKMEVHHIVPRRLNGSNSPNNQVTLCVKCHLKITGSEEYYIDAFTDIVEIYNLLRDAMHVMIGKKFLFKELSKITNTISTQSNTTYLLRKEHNVDKTHSNDAYTLIGKFPLKDTDIEEYRIKIAGRNNRNKRYTSVMGIKHKDLVEYTYTNGKTYRGYVTGLSPNKGKYGGINFTARDKICKGVNASKVKLLWSFTNIYWFPEGET